MAQRVESFDAATAAGGAAGTNFSFAGGDGTVNEIRVRFPKGCNNLVRCVIFYGDSPVIPFSGAEWLDGDDQEYRFEVEDFPTGDGWSAFVTNNDAAYAHTLRVTFLIDEVAVEEPNGGTAPILVIPWGT